MAKWLKNAVFYEIYPQSFQDSNGDGIGDIQGIIDRLDYIQELGCNAIWMNPCFDSPFTDAGYDVRDYYTIAPRYGTNEDAKRLFAEVHKRGMHILLDLVPGHTAIDHKWFQESMKAEENAYSKRYIWTDMIWEGFDGVQNIAGALRGISDRDGSCAVNFYSTQPALNYGFAKVTKPWQSAMDSEEANATRLVMQDIMAFWLGMGCDGFRVDMAGALVKQDEDGQGNIALWQKITGFLKEKYPEAALVSEWGEPDKSLNGGFDMDFVLHFGPSHYLDLFRLEHPYFAREGKGDVAAFVKRYQECQEAAQGKGLICIPSSNHDMPRISLCLDEEERKLAFAFLLSMPGAPFIYYGDEIGMKYLEGIRSVEGGYNRTGTRSPMQWDGTVNAGFSAAAPDKLYIMLDPDGNRPTVQSEMAREDSLYHEVKKLIALRQSVEALQSEAPVTFLYAEECAYPFVYQRGSGEGSVLIVINPFGEEASCTLTEKVTASDVLYSYGGVAEVVDGQVKVPGASVTFFTL